MNDKIKEIQTCLGMQPNYQTGNFGPLTQQALKTAGYGDLSQGITDQIYQTILANCKGKSNTTNAVEKPPLVTAPPTANPVPNPASNTNTTNPQAQGK
jgi:hypothetical protein